MFKQGISVFVATAALGAVVTAHTTEIAKLVPVDLGSGDQFGQSVALSGQVVAAGAPYHDSAATDAGAVYMFAEGASNWTQQQKLVASDAAMGDEFGRALDVDGETVLIGAPGADDKGANAGAAYVFVRSGTIWAQEAKLLAPDGAFNDKFGTKVALSGDTALVGAPIDDDFGASSGSAHVFVRSGTVWTHEQKLSASDGAIEDVFGTDLDLEGDEAIIGAPGDDDSGGESGSAYIFSRSGTVWTETIKLSPPAPADDDRFGTSVAITLDNGLYRAIVGAPYDDEKAVDAGAGYSYDRPAGTWLFDAKLLAPGTDPGALNGSSAAAAGDFLMLGAPKAQTLGAIVDAGKAHTFEGPAENQEIDTLTAFITQASAEFGSSVGVEGDWITGGAPYDNGVGAAYIFWRVYPAVNYCTAGTSASGCQANISESGFPSATEGSNFFLFATGVEGSKDGLFFYSTNGRQANTWGSGTSYQCVVPPVIRAGLLSGSGTNGVCDGVFIQDLNALWCATCPKPAKNPGPGAIVQAQLWYRDPFNTSNQTTSLSDGIEFGVNP